MSISNPKLPFLISSDSISCHSLTPRPSSRSSGGKSSPLLSRHGRIGSRQLLQRLQKAKERGGGKYGRKSLLSCPSLLARWMRYRSSWS
jgi:hypothetical protein